MFPFLGLDGGGSSSGLLPEDNCWAYRLVSGALISFPLLPGVRVHLASRHSSPSSAAAGWPASHSIRVWGALCGVVRSVGSSYFSSACLISQRLVSACYLFCCFRLSILSRFVELCFSLQIRSVGCFTFCRSAAWTRFDIFVSRFGFSIHGILDFRFYLFSCKPNLVLLAIACWLRCICLDAGWLTLVLFCSLSVLSVLFVGVAAWTRFIFLVPFWGYLVLIS
jgi:hypothetical protein